MPTNDFKPFATAGGANVSTQAEYLALAALSTGWQSGKASSKEVNKAVRQATFIAAALAQFVSDKGVVDVLDDGDLAGFGTKLISALNKTSQPLDATLTALAALVGAANKLPYFNGADTAALTDLTQVGRDIIGKADVAAVLTYLGLGKMATLGTNGYIQLSPVLLGGTLVTPILQWLRVDTSSAGTVIANLPIPYPNQLLFGFANERQPTGWGAGTATSWGFDSVNSNAAQISAYVKNIQAGSVMPATAAGIVVTLGY